MDIRFDDFELDPERFRLRRAGKLLRVEPRVLELLAYLVAHRERVVSKEELVQEVWEGRFVSDAAVSRAVYELRRALGEDSKHPRRILTVHGRGYRFGGELTVASAPGSKRPAAASLEGPPERSEPASRGWTGILIAAVFGLLVLATGWAFLPATSGAPEEPSPPPSRSVALAVLPIQPSEPSAELQLLGLSLTDLLVRRLGQIEGLLVREPDFSERAEPDNLGAYAERSGAKWLLIGSLGEGSSPQRIRVTVELVRYDGDRPLATPLADATLPTPDSEEELSQFLGLRDAIVEEVLQLLSPALQLPVQDASRPVDFRAYRLFLLAYRSMLDQFCDGRGALELLERSLEIDPGYAPAWELMAAAHYNRVWACGASPEAFELALEAGARAAELAPERVEPHLVRTTILVETGRVEDAYEEILEIVAEHRETPIALQAQIYALRYAGFLEEGRRLLDRLLEIDPLYHSTGASGETPNTLLYAGDLRLFLSILPDSDAAFHRYYRGLAYLLLEEPEAARAALEPAFRESPGEIFARYSQALLAVMEGDRSAARAIVEQIIAQRSSLGLSDGEMTFKEAQLLALAGDRAGAASRGAEAIGQGFICPRCFENDPFLSPLQEEPVLRVALSEARDRHAAFGERFGLARASPWGVSDGGPHAPSWRDPAVRGNQGTKAEVRSM